MLINPFLRAISETIWRTFMSTSDYRKRTHNYLLSMSIFKKMHDEGDISDELYEYMETRSALKYGIPFKSVIRMRLKRFKG